MDLSSIDIKSINTETMPEIKYGADKVVDKKAIMDDIYKMETLMRMGHKKAYIKARCQNLSNYSEVMFDSVFRLMTSSRAKGCKFDYDRMGSMLDAAIGISNGEIDGDQASKQFGTDMYNVYVAPRINDLA